MSRMTTSIYQISTPGLHLSESSASWLLRSCPLCRPLHTVILERQLTNGRKNRKMPGQICWSYPKVFDLELQDSSGLTKIIILITPFEPFPSARLPFFWGTSYPHLFLSRHPVLAHASCSRVFSQFWVQVVFLMREWP